MRQTTLAPLEDAATEVQNLARDNMGRDSFDFLGHMGEALMEAEECCPDGLLDDAKIEEYRYAMIELAALALAQAAMARGQATDNGQSSK